MPTPACPSREELTGYVLGTLVEDAAETLADHVENCPTCQVALRDVELASPDSVVLQMRQPIEEDVFAHEPRLQAVLAAVEAIGRDPSLAAARTDRGADSPARAPELQTIRDYRLLEKLGEGGMGAVYKALHTHLDKVVALKVLPRDRMVPAAVARFQREMRAVGKLQHPNIVGAYDAGEHEGRHFLVMEYVAGHDVSEVVRRLGALPVNDACEIVRQAAVGLQHAHEHGLVHRDIKPSNLMLTQEGQLKILDLGLALLNDPLANAGAAGGELTGAAQMMGTAGYMAPEQVDDSHRVDIRADIYSLGCTLYKLLSGEAPFSGPEYVTPIKKMMAHVGRAPLPVRNRRADVPVELATVVDRLLAKRPDDRYATPAQVAAAIGPFCAGADLAALAGRVVRDDFASDSRRVDGTSTYGTDAHFSSAMTGTAAGEAGADAARDPQYRERERPAGASAEPWAQPESPSPRRVPIPSGSGKGQGEGPKSQTNPKSKITNPKFLAVAAAAAILLLAAIVVRLKTADGTLVLTVNDPRAQVQIDGEKVAVTRSADGRTLTISVDRGTHTLRVTTPDGLSFTAPGKFELAANGQLELTATLEPAVVAANDPRPSAAWDGWPADAPPPAIAPFDVEQAKKHQQAWADYLKVPVEYENTIGMKFVLIPPGEFLMGSTPAEIEAALVVADRDEYWQECIRSEAPQHKVILTQPVYLGIHEVTQAQYQKVMGQNPSYFAATGPGKDVVGLDTSTHPVETVSWYAAAEFCTKLSEKEQLKPFKFELRAAETVTNEGTGYRLPTEAQWEFACRGGTTTKYWIGEKDEPLVQTSWFGSNSGSRPHAVGELKENPFGVYDIHGNVWEWVQDWWERNYYRPFQEQPALNPSGPSSAGPWRVFRGGGWGSPASYCRASDRTGGAPTTRNYDIGFRVALAVDAW